MTQPLDRDAIYLKRHFDAEIIVVLNRAVGLGNRETPLAFEGVAERAADFDRRRRSDYPRLASRSAPCGLILHFVARSMRLSQSCS